MTGIEISTDMFACIDVHENDVIGPHGNDLDVELTWSTDHGK